MTPQETTPMMSSQTVTRARLRNYTKDVGLLPESVILQMRALVKILAHTPGLGPEWAMRLDLSLIDALDVIGELDTEERKTPCEYQ